MNKVGFEKKQWSVYFRGLFEVFWSFFKIGSITFGGGLVMLPILENELAIKRKWTNRDELLDYYAIGQSTPGIIAVNVATFIGYKRRGIVGGIMGTLGMVTPSIIIITFVAMFLSNFTHMPYVQKALSGINIAVAALLTKVVWTFTKNTVRNIFHALLVIASFVLVSIFNVHTAWIILSSLIIGLGMHALSILKAQKAPVCKPPKGDGV